MAAAYGGDRVRMGYRIGMAARKYVGADEWVPDDPSLRALREAVQDCEGCDLFRDATQGVMGDGRRRASLVVLGEQPGDQEDRAGEPFVGPAGKLLDRALGDAGIEPASVFRTNVVKHFRWSGTRGKQRIHKTPGRGHVEACRPWLEAELALIRPKGVVVLGGTAGAAIFGSSFRVGEARGKPVDWPDSYPVAHPPGWVLPTTHPSSVLRTEDRDAAYSAFVADLTVAAGLL